MYIHANLLSCSEEKVLFDTSVQSYFYMNVLYESELRFSKNDEALLLFSLSAFSLVNLLCALED